MSFNGSCNGMYVDNDLNRPDFVLLRLEPVDANVNPARIELHNFTARGCTVSIRLGNDVILYIWNDTKPDNTEPCAFTAGSKSASRGDW